MTNSEASSSSSHTASPIPVSKMLQLIEARLTPEPRAVLNHHGYSLLDELFSKIEACSGFHKIITKEPRFYMPRQVALFYCSWMEDDNDEYTIDLPIGKEEKERKRVIDMILNTYDLTDEGDMVEDVTHEQIVVAINMMVAEPMEWDGKAITRGLMLPIYRMLLDFVQKVFLGHQGTFDAVTPVKLKVLAAVLLNLNINWGRSLLKLIIDEEKQIDLRQNTNGDCIHLHVKRPLRLSTKISTIIDGVFNKDKWHKPVEFDQDLIVPKSRHQVEMSLGIAAQIFVKVTNNKIREAMIAVGSSNDEWVMPVKKAKTVGEAAATQAAAEPTKRKAAGDVQPAAGKKKKKAAKESSPAVEKKKKDEKKKAPKKGAIKEKSKPTARKLLDELDATTVTAEPTKSGSSSPPVIDFREGDVLMNLHGQPADDVTERLIGAHMLFEQMQDAATDTVVKALPGIELTPTAFDMAKRFQVYLDIRDSKFYILEAILQLFTISDLKVEENKLVSFFGFLDIPDARQFFRSYVLTKMKEEAVVLNVNLAPFYSNEQELFQNAVDLASGDFDAAFNFADPSVAQSSPAAKEVSTSQLAEVMEKRETDVEFVDVEKEVQTLGDEDKNKMVEVETRMVDDTNAKSEELMEEVYTQATAPADYHQLTMDELLMKTDPVLTKAQISQLIHVRINDRSAALANFVKTAAETAIRAAEANFESAHTSLSNALHKDLDSDREVFDGYKKEIDSKLSSFQEEVDKFESKMSAAGARMISEVKKQVEKQLEDMEKNTIPTVVKQVVPAVLSTSLPAALKPVLDKELQEMDFASGDEIFKINTTITDMKVQHSDLSADFKKQSLSSQKQFDENKGNISTFLQYTEEMDKKFKNMAEEIASLKLIISKEFDDVKKGEEKEIQPAVQPKKKSAAATKRKQPTRKMNPKQAAEARQLKRKMKRRKEE